MRLQPRRPALVTRSVACVGVAVNLHDQDVFARAEVGDVAVDDDLAREFDPVQVAVTKNRLQSLFRLSHLAPQTTGAVARNGISFHNRIISEGSV